MIPIGFRFAAAAFALALPSVASGAAVPKEIQRQLPQGYFVMTSTTSSVGSHRFVVVALRSRKELDSSSYFASADRAPARPLLIFEQSARGGYLLAGRNDDVILRADDAGIAGNGCDPFGERTIAVKGVYFTVEHAVACGAHWTDYVTFRFDAHLGGFVFDNWRVESWSRNTSNDPSAEALVSDGQKVLRAKGRVVPFADWVRTPG
jgi:hypothetical protein